MASKPEACGASETTLLPAAGLQQCLVVGHFPLMAARLLNLLFLGWEAPSIVYWGPECCKAPYEGSPSALLLPDLLLGAGILPEVCWFLCPSEGSGMAKLWMERRVSDEGAGGAGAGDKGLLTFGWHSEPLAPLLRWKAHKTGEPTWFGVHKCF